MSNRGKAPRWLAPAALAAVAAVALLIIVSGGGSGSEPTAVESKPAKTQPKKTGATVYVVKQGDTLSAIALKTGISVETIQQLNPDVDVQAHQPGARLRLRQ